MSEPESELERFYEGLSRRLIGDGGGGADALAMHRMLGDPDDTAAAPNPHVLNRLIGEAVGDGARAVLDAGCGWGGTLLHLAQTRRAGDGFRGLGLTLSRTQAETATRVIAERGLAGALSVEQADFERRDFAPASFDVVLCVESITHSRSRPATLRRLARALKPGGSLLIVDDVRAAEQGPHSDDFAAFMRGWRYASVPSAGEWLAMLRGAGLRGEIARDLTGLYAPRPDAETDGLLAESRRELEGPDGADPLARYAIEAIIGGYMLERCYNRGEVRYLMLRGISEGG